MRVVVGFVLGLIALVLVAMLALGWMVRRTLPPDDETLRVAGLAGPVTIAYDSLGVPTIRATTLEDLAFGQGYAHARDRRFQMELQRRNAAGRLSELIGRATLAADRETRTLGFGAVAEAVPAVLSEANRRRFEAYAAGVNAWDAAHPAPPEFLLLGIQPEPWRVQDVALVIASMFRDLQDESDERMVEVMDATLPRALVEFLTPDATPDDVVLLKGETPAIPKTPGPEVVDVRVAGRAGGRDGRESSQGTLASASCSGSALFRRPSRLPWLRSSSEAPEPTHARPARRPERSEERAAGSNNWAIAASRTKDGHAILCGDPHLGLRVPTLWHRQRLEAPGVAITGATLPGAPDVTIGSNGRVAWSLTNVEGDFIDYVRVRPTADGERYAGPAGEEAFRIRTEVIRVKGAPAETLRVRETRWGPVVGAGAGGGLLAIQWGALDPRAYDFGLIDEDRAGSLDELFRAFDGFRGPAQNIVAADAAGRIGWRIVGRIPRRYGFDSRRPREAALATAGWAGEIPQDSMPRLLDPAEGFVCTANQRTVSGAQWKRVGSGAAMPWRARRIHDVLASRRDWDVAAAESLQNDLDDALLGPTARALDRALTPAACAGDSTLAAARRVLDGWTHRADTTSAAHALLRYARVALHELLFKPLIAPCVARDSEFTYTWALEDEVARRLLEERPSHLLDPRFVDYDALARAAVDSAASRLRARVPGVPLERIVWGRLNRSRIRHPIALAVPQLAPWLNMPDVALAGGSGVVRVARSGSGASLRLVAELGTGVARFSLPGGQSGNFLSKHYGDEYADWVAGRYGPLDPGTARHTIRLAPR